MASEKKMHEDMEYDETSVLEHSRKGEKKWGRWLLGLVVVIALLGYYGEFVVPIRILSLFHGDYQGVFLTNGQVYFGKLYREGGKYPVLRDIYYLQITQSPQPIRENETPPSNINLVKLGGELHGPSDEMRINREQILFIEDLESNSRVIEAIKQYKESQQQQ